MIAKFALHPIDTIKAKVQVSTSLLKDLSDYKPGRALELSNLFFFLLEQKKVDKLSGKKVSLASSEVLHCRYLDQHLPFLCI